MSSRCTSKSNHLKRSTVKIAEKTKPTAGLYHNYFVFSGGDVKQPKNKGKMAAATKGFFAPGCGF